MHIRFQRSSLSRSAPVVRPQAQSFLSCVLTPLPFLCVIDCCSEIQKELPSAVRAAFRVFDSDDNKFIDPEEFRSTLKVGTRMDSMLIFWVCVCVS
jgi:hypothetical protein